MRALVSFLLTTTAAEAKRAALVIGNGSYKAHRQLANPANDALLIADALKKAGFDVIDTKTDLGIAEFRQALRRFQSQATGADVALVLCDAGCRSASPFAPRTRPKVFHG